MWLARQPLNLPNAYTMSNSKNSGIIFCKELEIIHRLQCKKFSFYYELREGNLNEKFHQ